MTNAEQEPKAKSTFESTKFGAAYTKATKKMDSLMLGSFSYGFILRQLLSFAVMIGVGILVYELVYNWVVTL